MVGSLMFGMFPEHLAGSVLSSVCSCLDGQVYGSCCSSPLRLLFVASNDVSAELPFSKSNAASPLLLLLLLFLLLLLAGRAALGDASTTKQAATTNRTTITMAPSNNKEKKVGLDWSGSARGFALSQFGFSGLDWSGLDRSWLNQNEIVRVLSVVLLCAKNPPANKSNHVSTFSKVSERTRDGVRGR